MKRVILIGVIGIAALLIVCAAASLLAGRLGLPTVCILGTRSGSVLLPCPADPDRMPALTAGTAPTPAAGGRPVVVDTDMAADDWLAILYLLQRPELEVEAIAVVGTGEAHCDAGVRNARDLVLLAGRPDIPIACGRVAPLQGDHAFPDSLRNQVDSLLGLELPTNPRPPYAGTAVELLARTIRSSPQKVHVVALGPLTDLAEMLQAEPSLARKLSRITVMGGAIDVPGNVAALAGSRNTTAEWNIYVDPHAANVVLHSEAPVTLVPLDATRYTPASPDFYWRLYQDRRTPQAEFAYRVLMRKLNDILAGGYSFWDPLAAAIAVDDSLGTYREIPLDVVEEDNAYSGRTRAAPAGPPIRVAMAADRVRFEDLFVDTLNGR